MQTWWCQVSNKTKYNIIAGAAATVRAAGGKLSSGGFSANYWDLIQCCNSRWSYHLMNNVVFDAMIDPNRLFDCADCIGYGDEERVVKRRILRWDPHYFKRILLISLFAVWEYLKWNKSFTILQSVRWRIEKDPNGYQKCPFCCLDQGCWIDWRWYPSWSIRTQWWRWLEYVERSDASTVSQDWFIKKH